jgi:hypothetical protein
MVRKVQQELNWSQWVGSDVSSRNPPIQGKDATMFPNLKSRGALCVLICCAMGPMTGTASAITAELAKKCDVLTSKAFPPRVVGNPAAGSANGSAKDQRDYFSKCVANGGNPDDDAHKGEK